MNKQGNGVVIYISKREREHIGVQKSDEVIIDTTIPWQIRIMSIEKWKEKEKKEEQDV